MSQVLIPVPKTPFLDPRTGSVSREWFAFFAALLKQSNGGDSDTNLVIGGSPVSDSGQADQALSQAFEAWSQASSNGGQIEDLLSRFDGLDPQIPGPQEFGELAAILNGLTPFGSPPAEAGHLEAAKNTGYRIAASGNAVLVAGTATVNSVYADTANEWSLTAKVVGGTQGILSVGTVVANTSFVINSNAPADTSTVSWTIFAPIRG